MAFDMNEDPDPAQQQKFKSEMYARQLVRRASKGLSTGTKEPFKTNTSYFMTKFEL